MIENSKYFRTKSKTLAYALNYLGFKFYKYTNKENMIVYSFENSDVFKEKLRKLEDIKYL